MLAEAIENEVAEYVAANAHMLDEHGQRLVVRNGHDLPPITVPTFVRVSPMFQPCVPEDEAQPNPEEHTDAACQATAPRTPRASSSPACCAVGDDCNPYATDQPHISPRQDSGTVRRSGIHPAGDH